MAITITTIVTVEVEPKTESDFSASVIVETSEVLIVVILTSFIYCTY